MALSMTRPRSDGNNGELDPEEAAGITREAVCAYYGDRCRRAMENGG